MRTLDVRCDNCGKKKPADRRAATWYLLEDQSAVMRTGPMDFCSVKCLREWSSSPEVAAALPDLEEHE